MCGINGVQVRLNVYAAEHSAGKCPWSPQVPEACCRPQQWHQTVDASDCITPLVTVLNNPCSTPLPQTSRADQTNPQQQH
jgi:hypothetical protein